MRRSRNEKGKFNRRVPISLKMTHISSSKILKIYTGTNTQIQTTIFDITK